MTVTFCYRTHGCDVNVVKNYLKSIKFYCGRPTNLCNFILYLLGTRHVLFYRMTWCQSVLIYFGEGFKVLHFANWWLRTARLSLYDTPRCLTMIQFLLRGTSVLTREGPLCHRSDNTAGWLNDTRRILSCMFMLKAVIGFVPKLFDI